MKLKPGVSINKLHVSMRVVLRDVEAIFREHGHESVITGGDETPEKHSLASYHRYGMALDYRTFFLLDQQEKEQVTKEIAYKLGGHYTVVLESDHIHIQYNWKSPATRYRQA